MYSLPSRSQAREPLACVMKNGDTPNGYCVRLLLKVWLPSGITFCERARKACDLAKLRMVSPIRGLSGFRGRKGFGSQ